MRDRNDTPAVEEYSEFLLGDALIVDAPKQRGRHKDNPNARVPEPSVDLARHQGTERNVFLAEPHARAVRLQLAVKLGRAALTVIPGVAEEEVTPIGVSASLLCGLLGVRFNGAPLARTVLDVAVHDVGDSWG